MRKIVELLPSSDFFLHIKFDNGEQKKFDMKPYLNLPVFEPLKMPGVFKQVVNKGFFVEWPELELDLSADTLWHEGK